MSFTVSDVRLALPCSWTRYLLTVTAIDLVRYMGHCRDIGAADVTFILLGGSECAEFDSLTSLFLSFCHILCYIIL